MPKRTPIPKGAIPAGRKGKWVFPKDVVSAPANTVRAKKVPLSVLKGRQRLFVNQFVLRERELLLSGVQPKTIAKRLGITIENAKLLRALAMT